MALTINANDKVFVDAVAANTRTMNEGGVNVDSTGDDTVPVAYATKAVPVVSEAKPLDALIPPGSAADQKMQDITRSSVVPMALAMRPVGLQIQGNPGATFTDVTDLLVLTLNLTPDKPAVDRTFMATAAFACSATVIGTRIDFWVDVDGVATNTLKFLFSEDSSHRCVTGNWILTVPAGTDIIKLRAQRGAGTGSLSFDSTNDFASLTLLS